ncbi:MAG TPA: glycosyltransferase family 39 protein [Granulicella sp.]|jgi:4-amino-4-deoxy-L-arabinose transferase-like glycosyltransferase
MLFAIFFLAIALAHATLLRLPYFWDEGGYYIPAALDFFHRFTLIPEFTNAHPPLPNIVLGTLWHITGYRILATRLMICAFAAAALLAVFRMVQRLVGPDAAVAVTLLTALYPIWFAQSTLAHADIFAAAFTLWAFALYFTATQSATLTNPPAKRTQLWIAALFSLAALSKETAIVEPAALAAMHLVLLIRDRHSLIVRRIHATWLLTLSLPLLPLLAWYGYHHHRTGFTFGNPEYLRYNATANLSAAHIFISLYYRFLHLVWQRNIWVAIVLTLACLFLPRRRTKETQPLPPTTLRTIAVLVAANWLAFSILGGALLTRYLLPIYPLILLVCVTTWRARTRRWPWLVALTGASFFAGLWLSPPTSYAPEDSLTYRDMIVVHQEAIDYIAEHFPDARVLTAWPAAAELSRPDLGYTQRSIKVATIENFTAVEVLKARQEPELFDTALVITTRYTTPGLRNYLLQHPDSRRGRKFATERDLAPAEIASILGGQIVWQDNRDGEWAAVIRFSRSYEARLQRPQIATNAPQIGH